MNAEVYLNEQAREFAIREAMRLCETATVVAAEASEAILPLEIAIAKAQEVKESIVSRVEFWNKEAAVLRDIASKLQASKDKGLPFDIRLTILS